MSQQRISFRVHGTVQGVNFRAFTQRKASEYGVTGWVKNTDDNKVVGEAQGPEDALRKLKQDLNRGPRYAHVVKLETSQIETKTGEKSFSV